MLILLFSLLLGPVGVEAATVQELIKRAVENSAELRAMEQDVQSAESMALQAGRWDNPEVALIAGPMTAAPMSDAPVLGKVNGIGIDASIRQPIPLFGQKSVNARLGQQQKRVVESSRLDRSLLLRHEVVKLSYRLAALNEQVEHVAHRREKIGWVSQYLSTRPFASPSQRVEKALIQNRLREIEEKSLILTSMKEKTWQALNVYLSLAAPVKPDVSWGKKAVPLDRNECWSSLQQNNPELIKQAHVVGVADVTIDQAGKKRYPELKVGASYNEQSVEVPQRIYAGILEFSIPIFDRGGYAVDAARALKNAESDRLEQKRRELNASFEQAWAELAAQKRRVELYPISLVPELETEMKRAEEGWKKNLVSVVAFLEIENQVHDQIFRVYDAQADYFDAYSRILYLSGIAFESKVKNDAQ